MKLEQLRAFATGAPLPTEKIDVRLEWKDDRQRDPMPRQLTKVKRQIRAKRPWLIWYWTPEPLGPGSNGHDCGYSGLAEDSDLEIL